jgi:glycosyltransferase involved in cell wall biosynthesis
VKTLFYFCHYYPFGQREPLAETEVFQLAPHFEQIIIIPFFKEAGERPIPSNAKIHWFEKSTFSILSETKTCSTFDVSQKILKKVPEINRFDPWKLGFTRKWRAARMHAERLLHDLAIQQEDVLYAPWMNIWGPALSIIKNAVGEPNSRQKLVFRANGADLYQERMGGIQRKMQAISMDAATKIFPVSEHGTKYLQEKYPRHQWKIETAYHGSPIQDFVFQPTETKRWLTVSTLQTVKRLERLLEMLKKMEEPVLWTHIGGEGPALDLLKNRFGELPQNVSVDFRGRMRQSEILQILKTESFDLFLNVSDSEGLPLSAVEAAQAGIPLLLSDVGGSREIPLAEVLPVHPFSVEDWISKAKALQNASEDFRKTLQESARRKFGISNYQQFAEQLTLELQGTVVIMDDNLPGFSLAKALLDAGVSAPIAVIRNRVGRMGQLPVSDFDEKQHPKPWILFPLNEAQWEAARQWKDREPDSIRLTFNPSTRDISLHKHLQRKTTQEAGIPTAPFQLVADYRLGSLSFPLVVKPTNKMEVGRDSERLLLIHQSNDWEEQRKKMMDTDLVEPWKEGAKVAAVVGFRGENGVEQFSAFRRRCYPDQYTVFSTIEVIEDVTLLKLSKRILEILPIQGLFELEFLETKDGYQFLELNNRATTWIEAWRIAGKNVILQSYLWAMQQPTQVNHSISGNGWLVHRKHELLNLKHKPDQLFWLLWLGIKREKSIWV